jgi:molybdopterin synthase sulfur carrier subunit
MTDSPGTDHGVTVRYWAGARAAAGRPSDLVSATTVAQAVAAAVALRPTLAPVAAVATFLVDGRAATGEHPLDPGSTLEILPPFAGG